MPPSRLTAATAGARSATSQCSNRSLRWYRSDQNAMQSPTANTPGSEVRSCSSAATPLSIAMPDPSSQPTSGRTPTAVTTSSAGSHPPPASASPPGSTDATCWPSRSSTPASWYHGAVSAPSSAPRAAASGAAAASSTVTSQPPAAAAVASSAPIQPAPTIASRSPGRSSARSASASSMVRRNRCLPPPGRPTGVAPVASTRRSNRCSAAPARSTPSSRPVAGWPRHSSTSSVSRSSRNVVSSISPSISRLDSGGRSYGGRGSAPTSVTVPAYPAALSSSTVRRPASPAPATTIRSGLAELMCHLASPGPLSAQAGYYDHVSRQG